MTKKNSARQNINKGFSLIELLVVISIMGVLTAVLVMNFVGARQKAQDSKKVQDLNSLKNALRLYYNDNQNYPPTKADVVGDGFSGYMVNTSGISLDTYNTMNGGDGFVATVTLDSGGSDSTNSQKACNLIPTPSVYAVCSN
jgi:general secretion pathway protein G